MLKQGEIVALVAATAVGGCGGHTDRDAGHAWPRTQSSGGVSGTDGANGGAGHAGSPGNLAVGPGGADASQTTPTDSVYGCPCEDGEASSIRIDMGCYCQFASCPTLCEVEESGGVTYYPRCGVVAGNVLPPATDGWPIRGHAVFATDSGALLHLLEIDRTSGVSCGDATGRVLQAGEYPELDDCGDSTHTTIAEICGGGAGGSTGMAGSTSGAGQGGWAGIPGTAGSGG